MGQILTLAIPGIFFYTLDMGLAKGAKNAKNAVADLKSKGTSAVGVASFYWRGMTVSKLSSLVEIEGCRFYTPWSAIDDDINGQGVWDAAQGGSTSATESSNKNLASLYRPPFALMFNGPFEKLRQKKLLIVKTDGS
ncbi:hypothetical protein Tco_1094934 [Tanacetum coccineum]